MKDLLVLAFSSTDDIKMVRYLLFWNGKCKALASTVNCTMLIFTLTVI